MNKTPYPVQSLPPILKAAVFDAMQSTQAPVPMICASGLTAMSLAIQHLINVKLPFGKAIPVSLFLITCAESGERKSTVDKLFMKSIYDAEVRSEALSSDSYERFESSMAMWKDHKKELKKLMASATKKGNTESIESIRLNLKLHNKKKPTEPKKKQYILRDATPEAVSWHLYSNTPSAGLVSDEGGIILNGRVMQNLPMLNGYWDGSDVYVNRRDNSSFVARDKRLTVSVAVQVKYMLKFVNSPDSFARDSGFLARCLISYPQSTQGLRFINDYFTPSLDNLKVFQDRIDQILSTQTSDNHDDDFPSKKVLEFSSEARTEWIRYANMVESELAAGRYYTNVRDAASKSPEQAGRFAGLFHVLENKTGEISLETMVQAITLANWYLNEFTSWFSPPKVTQEMHDAMKIHEWLIARYCERQEFFTKTNTIRQYGPNSMRDATRLKKALAILCGLGCIQMSFEPTNGASFVQLNVTAPAYNPYITG